MPSASPTFGPIFVGLVFAIFLTSSNFHLTSYYTHRPADPWHWRAAAVFLTAVNFAHTGLLTYTTYEHLVVHFGDETYLSTAGWTVSAHEAILVFTALVSQLYFVHRLSNVYGGRVRTSLVGTVTLLTTAQFAFGIAATYYLTTDKGVSLFEGDLGKKASWLVLASSLTAVVANVLITVPSFLDMRTARYTVKSETVLEVLSRLIVETNFLTTIAAILSVAFYLAWDTQGHASGVASAFSILLPKLYLLAMLSSLNRGPDTVHNFTDSRAVKHSSGLSDFFMSTPLRRLGGVTVSKIGTPIADQYAGRGTSPDQPGWLRRTMETPHPPPSNHLDVPLPSNNAAHSSDRPLTSQSYSIYNDYFEDKAGVGVVGAHATATAVEVAPSTPTPRKATFGKDANVVFNGVAVNGSGGAAGAGRASSSSSASPPPSLLSHLSTSPSFAYTPSDPPSTPFTFLAPHPSSPPAPSSASPCACASKRDSSAPSPNPHLGPSPDHLKKRKLRHRFFRSDALFSPPSSPSASSSRPAASAPWWPSVSRQFGDGQESRFGPREEEWTGDGEGWEARLSLRLGRVELDFALEHFALEQEEQQEEQRARTVPPRPAPPPRSNSCPAMLQSHPLPPEAPLVAAEVPLEGPALKQALLRNLRARLASEGGASKAGEAGLRFKKWVVWNAFNRRQRDLALLESDESDIEIEVDSAPSASFGDSSLDGAGSLESSHLLGGMFDVLFDDDGELPTPPGASLLDEQDTFTSSSASEDDPGFGLFSSLLPLPLQPSTAPAPAEGGEEAVPRSFSSSARPGMRRTTSLPNVSLSGLACDSSAAAEVSGGGWGPIQVACEG
ncbi:hypothetical protein JCM8097_002346 [Rhodosporidiobolus ruineniae]